jgi:hypothetical protein
MCKVRTKVRTRSTTSDDVSQGLKPLSLLILCAYSRSIVCLILDTYSHVRRPHHDRMAELLA